jgi:predicted nucleotidyltransferase
MDRNTKNIILKDLKQNLSAQFDLNLLVLFGSQASGKANENSDFDILVVLNKQQTTSDETQIMDIN